MKAFRPVSASCALLLSCLPLIACKSKPSTLSNDAPAQSIPSEGSKSTSTAPASASPKEPQQAGPSESEAPSETSRWRAFDTSGEAVQELMRQTTPQIIAFGEAHQRKGEQGDSTAERFRRELLPSLAPVSSELLLEILSPSEENCAEEEERVREETAAITAPQAVNNQADYIRLGKEARARGVPPKLLPINCAGLAKIAADPALSVLITMESIAEITKEELKLSLRAGSAPNLKQKPVLLAYGGALHNDLYPAEARKSWSFGPFARTLTQDNYVEVDLVQSEQFTEASPWKKMQDAALIEEALQAKNASSKSAVYLVQRAPKSYYLLF